MTQWPQPAEDCQDVFHERERVRENDVVKRLFVQIQLFRRLLDELQSPRSVALPGLVQHSRTEIDSDSVSWLKVGEQLSRATSDFEYSRFWRHLVPVIPQQQIVIAARPRSRTERRVVVEKLLKALVQREWRWLIAAHAVGSRAVRSEPRGAISDF
jgi:hypothetical protein